MSRSAVRRQALSREPPAAVTPIKLPGMARKVVMRDPKALRPFERNARIHTDKQVEKIAASMRQFGFTMPLLVDAEHGCEIIAGHGRQLAALKLGLPRVPTIDGSWMSEPERRAYRIADNKLTLDADWDDELLSAELADLDLSGFDLSLTGFSDGELKGLGIGGLGAGGDAEKQSAPPSWAVVTEVADEAAQVALIAQLEAQGFKCKGTVG